MKSIPKSALYIMNFISNAGYEARLVGGYVRNHIIGKLNETDIDMATNMPVNQLITHANSHGIKCIRTGIKYGTVTLLIENTPIEITTLRKDVKTNGRHAEIEYTTSWFEDSLRRDFTFNAMYMDVRGEVYDFHGGIKDLNRGIIRFIGPPQDRIQEDYLRILRYFRFLTYYTPTYFDQEVVNILRNNISGLCNVSSERLYNELMIIFKSNNLIYTINKFMWLLEDVLAIKKNCFTEDRFCDFHDISAEHKLATLLAFNGDKATDYALSRLKPPKAFRRIVNTLLELSISDNFAKDLLLLNKDTRKQMLQNLSFIITDKQAYSNIQYTVNNVQYEFDITGKDIRCTDVRMISQILKTLKYIWASNYGAISKTELLKQIKIEGDLL